MQSTGEAPPTETRPLFERAARREVGRPNLLDLTCVVLVWVAIATAASPLWIGFKSAQPVIYVVAVLLAAALAARSNVLDRKEKLLVVISLAAPVAVILGAWLSLEASNVEGYDAIGPVVLAGMLYALTILALAVELVVFTIQGVKARRSG